MKNLGKIFLTLILIVGSFLVGLLSTHVVLSIAFLFQLGFITQFSFIQLYGIFIIIDMIMITLKINGEKDKDVSYSDKLVIPFTNLLTKITVVCVVWGFAYLAYAILK